MKVQPTGTRILDAVASESIRLLIAEDNIYIRQELRALLGEQDEFTCVGLTSRVEEIVPLCQKKDADVVILDIDLHGKSSLQELPGIRKALPGVRFVIFSGHANPEMIRGALKAGASAYITKITHTDRLIEAIKQAGGDSE